MESETPVTKTLVVNWRVLVVALLLFIAAEALEIHRHLAGIQHYEPSGPKAFALLMIALMAILSALYSERDKPNGQ